MIATSSNENLESEGVFTSSGKSLTTALIFRWASVRRKLTSAPLLRVTITIDTPSSEVDSTFLILSNEEIASSIFLVTELSTSAGDAPG